MGSSAVVIVAQLCEYIKNYWLIHTGQQLPDSAVRVLRWPTQALSPKISFAEECLRQAGWSPCCFLTQDVGFRTLSPSERSSHQPSTQRWLGPCGPSLHPGSPALPERLRLLTRQLWSSLLENPPCFSHPTIPLWGWLEPPLLAEGSALWSTTDGNTFLLLCSGSKKMKLFLSQHTALFSRAQECFRLWALLTHLHSELPNKRNYDL